MRFRCNAAPLVGAWLCVLASSASAQSIFWSSRSTPAERIGCPLFHNPGDGSALDADGNLLLIGCADGIGLGASMLVRKVHPDGATAWTSLRAPPEAGSITATSIALDASGDVLVSGFASAPGLFANFLTLKFDGATGGLLWDSEWSENMPFTYAAMVAVDGTGDVFVAGPNQPFNATTNDLLLIKYNGVSGEELWRSRYVGGGDFSSVGGLVVDASGDALLAGYVGLADGEHMATVKFNGDDGQQQWARLLKGDATGINRPIGIAVDASGNAVVAGVTTEVVGGRNVVTIKYSGTDGATLWQARYDGAASGSDFPNRLVRAGDGDITVAGGSIGVDSGQDFLTLRYRDDGSLRWVRRFSASNASYEQVEALAVDAYGNAYVAGGAMGQNGGTDYTVLGYGGADGRLLWQLQHDFGEQLGEAAGELRWFADGTLWVAGDALTAAGYAIGILKLSAPILVSGFEDESAPSMR